MTRMAWEWVAPTASTTAAIVVGVTGIVATYRAGSRQQATALAVTGQQVDAQVAVAREERQQRRLEEAYLELLAVVTTIRYWVFTVYPEITQTPEQYTMPPIPQPPDAPRKERFEHHIGRPVSSSLWKNGSRPFAIFRVPELA
jgi:hypothetical protein